MTTNNPPDLNAEINPANLESKQKQKRKFWLMLIFIFVLIAAIAYLVYWTIYLRHFESTDNAYVNGNIVQISPQINGTVVAVYANDTDLVREGQPLLELDKTDAAIALTEAEANLAQTVREVRTLYANNQTLIANANQRSAEVKQAEDAVVKANEDYQRRVTLAATGAVSREDLQHAKSVLDESKSALQAAKSVAVSSNKQIISNRSLTDGTTVSSHPNVIQAETKVKQAYVNLARAEIVSPANGLVVKRNVQVGQRVSPGAALMAVVPLDQVWVEANFKESQLANMRNGQSVKLQADVYGNKVTYQGKIQGFSAGTGAAFSLLPAQNATGNWIKIVQRLPVRIAVDADQLKKYPLRIGLSMQAEVDTQAHAGEPVSVTKQESVVNKTRVFDGLGAAADQVIQKIVSENLSQDDKSPSNNQAKAVQNLSITK